MVTPRSNVQRRHATILPPPPRGRRDELTVAIPLLRPKPVRGWTFTVPDIVVYLAGTVVWTAAAVVAAYAVLGFFGVLP